MKIYIQLFTLFLILNCKQKDNLEDVKIISTELIFNQPKFSDIQKIENKNNGIEYKKPYNIVLSKEYFPEIDKYEFAQPKIYRRDTTNLKTQISYFYTKKDSIVRLIEYSWSRNKKQKPFINELYEFNKSRISQSLSLYGNEKYEQVDDWWQKIVRWDNDSIHIYSFIFGTKEAQRTRIIIKFKIITQK